MITKNIDFINFFIIKVRIPNHFCSIQSRYSNLISLLRTKKARDN